MLVEQIARVCHEINAAYCRAIGDDSQPTWKDAPQWQKDSAIAGVNMHLQNPNATPEDSHKSWLAQKEADGWKYGPVKDPEKKEHPCYVPYDALPESQKAKDYLFRQTVHSLKPYYTDSLVEEREIIETAKSRQDGIKFESKPDESL
jgi:RyR domain